MNALTRFTIFSVRLTLNERRALEILARREGVKSSEFMRELLRREIRTLGVPVGLIGVMPPVEESEVKDKQTNQ